MTTAFGVASVVMLLGYAVGDKGFAYIKPPGPVYMSEVLAALGVTWALMHSAAVRATFRAAPQLFALGCFMAWGAILTGLAIPTYGLDAARDGAIWYYGVFSVLIASFIAAFPHRLSRALRSYARFLPLLLVWLPIGVFTARLSTTLLLPDGVSLLASKSGNTAIHAIVAVAFLNYFGSRYFSPAPRRALMFLAFVDALVASTQARGGLIGLLISGLLLVVFFGRKRAGIVIPGFVFLLVVGSFLYVTDFSISTARDREISADQFTSNFASVLRGGTGVDDSNLNVTTEWRRVWTNVLAEVDDEHANVIGLGFGRNLGADFLEFPPKDIQELRSPHNSHLDVYARLGLVGIGLWALLWGTWFATVGGLAIRRIVRPSDESALAAMCVAGCAGILFNAFVDPTLEGPQVAIWAWTLHGVGVAAWLCRRRGVPLVVVGAR